MTPREIDLEISFERQVGNPLWLRVKGKIWELIWNQVKDKARERIDVWPQDVWSLVEQQVREDYDDPL
jgi:hypothetical protein